MKQNGTEKKKNKRLLSAIARLLSGYYTIIIIGIFCIILLFTIMILI